MGLLLTYFYEEDQNASRYAYYGLMGLRHRGYRVSYAGFRKGDLVEGVIDPWRNDWELPPATALIAAVEPTAKTYVGKKNEIITAIATDGCMLTEDVIEAIISAKDIDSVAFTLEESLPAYCTLIVLRSDRSFLIARGSKSTRPLSIGGYGFDALYAATETAPITLMGGDYKHDIGLGEIIYGDSYRLERIMKPYKDKPTCLFEYIYLARPDSYVDGVNVYKFREEMGRKLAKRHSTTVDLVVGVPETAIPYALGYSRETGTRIVLGFISTIGRMRTAITPLTHEERLMALSLKLNPVPEIFESKSIAIIDDSIVTGLTLKTVIHRLKRMQGVREVHIAVSSPKIIKRCRYGVQLLEEENLIARQLDDEIMTKVLGADSITWLTVEDAMSYLEKFGIKACIECMSR